jgi:hypothetical protein
MYHIQTFLRKKNDVIPPSFLSTESAKIGRLRNDYQGREKYGFLRRKGTGKQYSQSKPPPPIPGYGTAGGNIH